MQIDLVAEASELYFICLMPNKNAIKSSVNGFQNAKGQPCVTTVFI